MFRGYTVNLTGVSLTAAITDLIELTAHTNRSLIVTRAQVSQQSNTTSTQQAIQVLRETTAGTNVSSPVNAVLDQDDAASGFTSRGLATTLGTASTILVPDSFNWQNGYLYLPVPEERYSVVGAGFIAFKVPVAPPALTVNVAMSVLEIG